MKTSSYSFQKSDIGAQSAWKGFSAQTLYIASRIISDQSNSMFFPEDIEDLVVKCNNNVVEAVQVKNITADLTLSSLASTKTSARGDGFFKRVCSLHKQYPDFNSVRVVYFNSLGTELDEFKRGVSGTKERIQRKLISNHGIDLDDAEWLLSAFIFEKCNLDELDSCISEQIHSYLPTMVAPDMAKSLLIQYISNLSHNKEYTSLHLWQEEIHRIGTNIAAIDGYFKVYGKSLIRLSELSTSKNSEQLRNEFMQGVSAHPAHIREELDFRRNEWIAEIQTALNNSRVALIKGVSGQGKTALCYRYLIDNYPEELVFCIRSIATETQAYDLVSALESLAKHAPDIAVYIDVQPGENQWVFLLQELQLRGLCVPVLISIRDEDYNLAQLNGKFVKFDTVELSLSEQEARNIYDSYTKGQPHPDHRSFEEAWQKFGTHGPLIEFMYLLTNSQTLTQRLNEQVDALLLERIPDSWFDILQLVCLTGRLGCSVNLRTLRTVINCDNVNAAIKRFSDEYLIKISDNGAQIEALHPVRAHIIFDALNERIDNNQEDIVIAAINCIDSSSIRYLLFDYFTSNEYTQAFIYRLATTHFSDWTAYAGVLNAMLWLDVKRYVDANMPFIQELIKQRGKGWLTFIPIDMTGLLRPNELIAEGLINMPGVNKTALQTAIQEVKSSLTAMCIDYQATDIFVGNCTLPNSHPKLDSEWTNLGYSLFWLSNRNITVDNFLDIKAFEKSMNLGDIQSKADCLRGIIEHEEFADCYSVAKEILVSRIINAYQVIFYEDTSDTLYCKFVPPMFGKQSDDGIRTKHFNHHWRLKMLALLQQIYPQKEYIDIELLGVDLHGDLGIEPLDYKLHIHKENRRNSWITDINAWAKTRIDYYNRPNSWKEYVERIDCVRTIANQLVVEIIGFIDFLYKKRRFNKDKWDRVVEKRKQFNVYTFGDNLLPISVVDPYCLYREDMSEDTVSETPSPVVSVRYVDKYKKFRKSYTKTFQPLDNFFQQCEEVLTVRVLNKSIDGVKKPRLAIYNLFDSAKNIVGFQTEYQNLFSLYSTLDTTFATREVESLLVLVNMWSEVLANAPRGFSLSYEAKQRHKKSFDYFNHVISNFTKASKVKMFTNTDTAYLMFSFDPMSGTTLEQEYANAVTALREAYKDAIPYSSERWQIETQVPELVYVPLYRSVPLSSGFSIPTYKLLDTTEEKIASSLFPVGECEDLYCQLRVNSSALIQWKKAISQVGTIRLLLQQYNLVLAAPSTATCKEGFETYLSALASALEDIFNDFPDVSGVIDDLQQLSDEQVAELLGMIAPFFKSITSIPEKLSSRENLADIEEMANKAAAAMVLLQPCVVNSATS